MRQLAGNAASSGGVRFAAGTQAVAETRLVFDQGLDTNALPIGYMSGPQGTEDSRALTETAYLVEVDSRLLALTTPADLSVATPSFIDDDNVATYYFALGTDNAYFARQDRGLSGGTAVPAFNIINGGGGATRSDNSAIGPTNTTGRLGSRLIFGLRSSLNLQNSDDLFNRLGSTEVLAAGGEITATYKTINTVVRLTGFKTGYRVEIPLKLLKS